MKTVFTIISSWCEEPAPGAKRPFYIPGMARPLSEAGGLSATLRSLRPLPSKEHEIVIVALASEPAIEGRMEEKLNSIIKAARPKCPVQLVTRRALGRLKARLEEVGFGRYRRFVKASSLSHQRNLALFLGYLAGGEAVVVLEEGAEITDKGFLKRLAETAHGHGPDHPVDGVGIYGMQPDGGRLFNESVGWRDTGWPKDKLINQTLHMIGKADRFADTPFVFGNKMVAMRTLIENVCFDPYMHYGHDLDFLLNARLLGHKFVLDRLLVVKTTNPPPRERWRRYRQDLFRFVHMRYKLTHQKRFARPGKKLGVEDLNPYPGTFLRFSVYARALLANGFCFLGNLARLQLKSFHYLANICCVPLRARWGQRKKFRSYINMLSEWRDFIRMVREDAAALRKIVFNTE